MNVGIYITARLGSSRLKRKHLLSVGGKPLLQYLLDRIAAEFAKEMQKGEVVTVIVSSDEPENRDFERFSKLGIQVFYGSIKNIPLRHHQAAHALKLDAIIGVDGDDILCSVRGMRAVYSALQGGAQYVRTKGLPFGMNSFGYTSIFLERSVQDHRSDVLETGWGKIFAESALTEIVIDDLPNDNRLRFTLDYQEDYEFFSAVVEAFGERIITAGDGEIVNVVQQKTLFRLNEQISQEYWANFYRCMAEEGSN